MGSHSVHFRGESGLSRDRRLVTIDVLPDDVLVEIFEFYLTKGYLSYHGLRNTWRTLVYVCRRWRHLVFASPRRLNLRLEYEGFGPLSELPDAWPVMPLILLSSRNGHPTENQRWDNWVAALESEHYNRICEIGFLDINSTSRWEGFAAAMQKPFPELTRLEFSVHDGVQVLPDSFLGRSAPRLQELWMINVPFPSIPKLLLSANGLVTLTLEDIPDSGYFSPDAMATALSVMTRLKFLDLQFRSPRSLPDPESRPLPPPTPFVLPALTELTFRGAYEYSEDLLARIDAPLLYNLLVMFSVDVDLDVPQLHRFIGHAEEFKACNHAKMSIFDSIVQMSLYSDTWASDGHEISLVFRIDGENGEGLDWLLSSLAQTFNFPLIPGLEELAIGKSDKLPSHWIDDVENAQWVELLDLFTAVEHLYLLDETAGCVCGALQELPGERAAEVLPALRNLSVDKSVSLEDIREAMRPFVSARRHPVTIKLW